MITLSVALCLSMMTADRRTENVVLVTLDGVRIEEMFGGLDDVILCAEAESGKAEDHPLTARFGAATPEARRAKLMPFFWNVLMAEHGSIAGNPAGGSPVRIANRHRFSYPGYSEILTGVARDDEIDSNDRRRNPHPTVLEFLKRRLALDRNGVCAFASWDVFRWIVEHEEGALTVNAGFHEFVSPDPEVTALSALQFETPTPWNSVRHDVYTFRFAMDHLRRHAPRVTYLALGETDDWAHDRRYDRVVEALVRNDRQIEALWRFLQSDDRYAGKTTVLITTDHGRGRTPENWTDHGAKVAGAEDVWLACMSPDVDLRGEWGTHALIELDRVAATMAALLGEDWRSANPEAGRPIEALIHP